MEMAHQREPEVEDEAAQWIEAITEEVRYGEVACSPISLSPSLLLFTS